MTHVYLLIDAVIVVLLVALLIAAMAKGGYRNRLNRYYAYCVGFIALWVPSLHISNDTDLSSQIATGADFVVFASSLATAVMILKILVELSSNRRTRTKISYEPILWIMVALAATPLVSQGVVVQGDVYGVVFGPLAPVYMATVAFVVIMMLREFIVGVRTLKGVALHRFVVVGISVATTTVMVALLSLVLPLITGSYFLTEMGLAPMLILVAGLYYSVVKHQLFDIKLVAIRTVAYALSIITMAGAYFSLAYFVSILFFKNDITTGISMSPINIVLALVLAFVFQPIKRFFDHWTNRIFYRDRYDTDAFIGRLSRVLTSTTQLHEVLDRALHEISSTLKANGGLFVVYRDHHENVLVGHRKYDEFSGVEWDEVHHIVELNGRGMLVVDDDAPHQDTLLGHIHHILARRHVALVLPLTTVDSTIGYLFLGEQMGSNYTQRDIEVLETVADELVIAIQNARSVQAVRDLNTHLEQRINSATKELRASNKRLMELDAMKDEFVSMASHQLRTPLTSVKGYISMVLEGDVGKISDQQRQLLQEAFTSSERMVHLISDFLNVSRLQTGKFVVDRKETDLAEVTRQEVANIAQIAVSHQVDVKYKKPAVFPMLYLDDGKIRQVIMNFIDNAIYYSPDAESVKVTLSIEDGDAVLRVIDKGMGVPEEAQKKLFTKFFRAENARRQRPDGTGVGLFLAKKVIDGHGGSLVFESTLGKGSTFGFRLPIKKLSIPPSAEERAEVTGTLPPQ